MHHATSLTHNGGHIRPWVAIVDCNNFYASCERLADPTLIGRPVAVLSSNDGCIIARSEEVKALGIGMGAPLFKVRDLVRKNDVVIRSANFDFYVDVSARIMRILAEMVPVMEAYSIDEAFLDFTGLERFHDLEAFSHKIRQRILDEVGIPVSIGIAPTKVLAKVANHRAKKAKTTYVEWLRHGTDVASALADFGVERVWGIGPRTAFKLNVRGIRTAGELVQQPDAFIAKMCAVTELRVLRELKGIPAIPIETEHKPKQHIGTSRSFGHDVTCYEDLREAVAYFVTFAAVKLRKQHSVAGAMYVYARTNPFRKGQPLVRLDRYVRLPQPTDHTPELIRAALTALEEMYDPKLNYKKAGILLHEIVPASSRQINLFAPAPNLRRSRISRVADEMNVRFGKSKLTWAVFYGPDKSWMPLSEYRSKPLDLGVTEADRDRVRPWW